jgi:hypothetical protein
VCIDFVDKNIGMMVGMWKKRMRIYRQKGVENCLKVDST